MNLTERQTEVMQVISSMIHDQVPAISMDDLGIAGVGQSMFGPDWGPAERNGLSFQRLYPILGALRRKGLLVRRHIYFGEDLATIGSWTLTELGCELMGLAAEVDTSPVVVTANPATVTVHAS